MDHRDAGRERVGRSREMRRLAVELEPPVVRSIDAGDQLAERALTRAVFAAQGVAGAGRDLEADAIERRDARKPLRDVAKRNTQSSGVRPHLHPLHLWLPASAGSSWALQTSG